MEKHKSSSLETPKNRICVAFDMSGTLFGSDGKLMPGVHSFIEHIMRLNPANVIAIITNSAQQTKEEIQEILRKNDIDVLKAHILTAAQGMTGLVASLQRDGHGEKIHVFGAKALQQTLESENILFDEGEAISDETDVVMLAMHEALSHARLQEIADHLAKIDQAGKQCRLIISAPDEKARYKTENSPLKEKSMDKVLEILDEMMKKNGVENWREKYMLIGGKPGPVYDLLPEKTGLPPSELFMVGDDLVDARAVLRHYGGAVFTTNGNSERAGELEKELGLLPVHAVGSLKEGPEALTKLLTDTTRHEVSRILSFQAVEASSFEKGGGWPGYDISFYSTPKLFNRYVATVKRIHAREVAEIRALLAQGKKREAESRAGAWYSHLDRIPKIIPLDENGELYELYLDAEDLWRATMDLRSDTNRRRGQLEQSRLRKSA